MTWALVGASVVVLIWAFLLLSGIREFRRTPLVGPDPTPIAVDVTAFMPARNEAEVIERAVDGVLGQAGLTRVIAIDDGSTDDTPALLSAKAGAVLEVIHGRGPAEGECGKPAALAWAYETTKPDSEWLLFVDADVVLEPGALHTMLNHAAAVKADLVTLLPRLTLASPIEKIVMPSIGALIVAQYPPAKVADPDRPEAFANGQVILVRRVMYERVGGHRAVINEILEDVRLAERVKHEGGRLAVMDGRLLAATRMYDGWRELREGWTKNLFLLMGSSVARTALWVVLSVGLGWSGWITLGLLGVPFGLVTFGFVLVAQMILRRGGGTAWPWAVFAPLSALLTAFILIESAWRHTTGKSIAWKGRRV